MPALLRLPEDLDAASMEELRPTFESLARNADDVELDLSAVRFIDSSGVGGIVFLYKRLRAAGYNLWLTGVSSQPRRLLEYVGLLSLTTRSLEGAES
jgi:anti-anti-sigma factor